MEESKTTFKLGDRVRCVRALGSSLASGEEYIVCGFCDGDTNLLAVDPACDQFWDSDRFVLVSRMGESKFKVGDTCVPAPGMLTSAVLPCQVIDTTGHLIRLEDDNGSRFWEESKHWVRVEPEPEPEPEAQPNPLEVWFSIYAYDTQTISYHDHSKLPTDGPFEIFLKSEEGTWCLQPGTQFTAHYHMLTNHGLNAIYFRRRRSTPATPAPAAEPLDVCFSICTRNADGSSRSVTYQDRSHLPLVDGPFEIFLTREPGTVCLCADSRFTDSSHIIHNYGSTEIYFRRKVLFSENGVLWADRSPEPPATKIDPGQAAAGVKNTGEQTLYVHDSNVWTRRSSEPDEGKSQALRYNSNKPESDYIFTYEGGIDATFEATFEYYETLIALRDLYQAKDEADTHERVSDVLNALRGEAAEAGDSIIDLIAETNTIGAAKYEQGNYLLGANWRQYFQCAARHAEKIANGEEYDYDPVAVARGFEKGFPHRGNFFFNVLALCHCVSMGLGTDDRIRAPKKSSTK